MPFSNRLRRGLLSTCLAALTLTACSSAPQGGPSPTGRGSASAQQGVAAAGSLARLLITDVPAGFRQASEKASHTGNTDLAEAIRLDGRPDAATALTAEGFRAGYQRLWTNGHGELIAVQVYRFATADGARANFARAVRGARSQAAHVVTFPVGGQPATRLLGVEVNVEGNRSDQVIGVSGSDVMQVLCTSTTATDLQARAAMLGARQLDRLPATG